MIAKIRTDVDPCDDFYEFACGKFGLPTDIAVNPSELISSMHHFRSTTDFLTNQTLQRTRGNSKLVPRTCFFD